MSRGKEIKDLSMRLAEAQKNMVVNVALGNLAEADAAKEELAYCIEQLIFTAILELKYTL